MMKKQIAILAIFTLGFASCDVDQKDLDSNIVQNDKIYFEAVNYDVQLEQEDVSKVLTGNAKINLLGFYNPSNYKKINASIISGIRYSSPIKIKQSSSDDKASYGTQSNIDSVYTLDKVILKIPYLTSRSSDGDVQLVGVLGDKTKPTGIKVMLNNTYLNRLDPANPKKKMQYYSNHEFEEGPLLTEEDSFEFIPKATDLVYKFQRTKVTSFVNGEVGAKEKFDSEIKIINSNPKNGERVKPFLAVPLDLAQMKTLFWDKFESNEFANADDFKDYIKGVIIKSVGEQGSLFPIDFSSNPPSIDFCYTISRLEDNVFKDTVDLVYSLPLGGITTGNFAMSGKDNETPANCINVQGTAGSEVDVTFFTKEKLQELRADKVLVNNAVMTFYVNQSVDTDYKKVPKRLLLYRTYMKGGKEISEHIIDNPINLKYYDGFVQVEDDKPIKYSVNISDYIKDVISGDKPNSGLKLRVFNDTDLSIQKVQGQAMLDNVYREYNWDARGVTLYDGSSENAGNKVQLKVSYSKQK